MARPRRSIASFRPGRTSATRSRPGALCQSGTGVAREHGSRRQDVSRARGDDADRSPDSAAGVSSFPSRSDRTGGHHRRRRARLHPRVGAQRLRRRRRRDLPARDLPAVALGGSPVRRRSRRQAFSHPGRLRVVLDREAPPGGRRRVPRGPPQARIQRRAGEPHRAQVRRPSTRERVREGAICVAGKLRDPERCVFRARGLGDPTGGRRRHRGISRAGVPRTRRRRRRVLP